MNFNEYETRALVLAIYPKEPDPLTYPTLGLTGEAGEVAEKVKKRLRDGAPATFTEDMCKELGDVLWYLTACASALGLTLEQVAEANLTKLESRAARDKLQGSGDDR